MNLTASQKKILSRIIAVIMLMEMLDATVLNTALPQIAMSLHVNPIRLKEVLTVYFLSLGVFVPVSGWVADRFGEKKSMLFAIVLFTFSSLACGLSVNVPMLIFFRLLQGIGGAFLMPVGRQILVRVFPGLDRVKAMAHINVMTLLGLLLGPLIGGALTTYANWRWIFFVNLPIGVSGIFLINRYLPMIREQVRAPFDWLGFILIGASLGALLFLLDIAVDQNIHSLVKYSLLITSLGAILLYIPYARQTETPLISLSLFSQGGFSRAAISSFLSRLTSATHPFLIPLLLQAGYGFSAVRAGLYTVPVIFSTLLSMMILPKLVKHLDNKMLLMTSSVLLILVYMSFSFQAISLNLVILVIQQLVMGFVLPIQVSLMNSQAYQSLTDAYVSQGTSVYSGIIQVSGSFGIALAALVMIAIIGPNDLQHHVPLIAFKTVFIIQSMYSLLALGVLVKLPSGKLS